MDKYKARVCANGNVEILFNGDWMPLYAENDSRQLNVNEDWCEDEISDLLRNPRMEVEWLGEAKAREDGA